VNRQDRTWRLHCLSRWAAGSGKLSVMAFKVRFSQAQDKPNDYDTGDVYNFLDGGVLSIAFAANKAKWTEYHAPGTWLQVVAEANHAPGQSGY
jgi:hypothetical protein